MMPNLYTTISPVGQLPKMTFDGGIVSFGSCFADEVALRMQQSGFKVERNPFGTLYNPASIADALRLTMEDTGITTGDIVEYNGLWHSWRHHGSFSRQSTDELVSACNEAVHRAHAALAEAKVLLITFGTAWVFEHEGRVVANCHKLPAERFIRRMLTVDETVRRWLPLLDDIFAFNPDINVVFTVSPIRHMADGAHGNQLSKATLLLAIDQLCQKPWHTYYFPAYEIVLDELRDYRFYRADLVHPTDVAVDIVWHRFQEATLTPAQQQQAHNNAKAALRLQHKPIANRAGNKAE